MEVVQMGEKHCEMFFHSPHITYTFLLSLLGLGVYK